MRHTLKKQIRIFTLPRVWLVQHNQQAQLCQLTTPIWKYECKKYIFNKWNSNVWCNFKKILLVKCLNMRDDVVTGATSVAELAAG